MFSFFSGGGSGGNVDSTKQWAHVAVDGTIPSLATGTPLSLPFTVFTGGSPHPSWLSFTTTNGTVLLDTGLYTFTWNIVCSHTGDGKIAASLESWQGFIGFTGTQQDTTASSTLLGSGSGFIDINDPIDLILTNGYIADITFITADLTIVKAH